MSLYKDASLAMIPSAYKDGKLYSIRPTDGSGDFTFSRGSNLAATRVDVNGLIEKGRENLITYSQDATQWSSQKSTRVSATEADPFGGNSAAEYAVSSITGGSYFYRTISPSLSSGQVFTGSIYVKNVDQRYVQLTFGTAAFGSSQYQNFDLQTGTKGTGTGMIDSTITSVGNDWYRISITKATISSGASGLVPCFVPSESATRLQAPAVVGRSFQAFGFQLEQGLVATDYIETGTSAAQSGIFEDMPRLDYSGGASCPSLLLEPQRTNKFLFSEYYGSGALSIYATGTYTFSVTNNYGISPEGVQNAIRFVADVTSANDRVVLRDGVSCGGGDHTLSFYAKSNTSETYTMKMHFDGSGKKLIEVTPEWQRFEYGESANSICNAGIECSSASGYSASVDISVYGFQLEENLYPTSYIPTYGSSVTRSKESFNMNLQSQGIFESSDTQGVLMIEYEKPNTGENIDIVRFMGASANGRGFIYNSGVNFASDWAGGVSGVIDHDGNNKTIWRLNTLSAGNMFHNGSKLGGEATGTAWSDIRLLRFNMEGLGGVLKIKQILLFPTALTDSECIALTTL